MYHYPYDKKFEWKPCSWNLKLYIYVSLLALNILVEEHDCLHCNKRRIHVD